MKQFATKSPPMIIPPLVIDLRSIVALSTQRERKHTIGKRDNIREKFILHVAITVQRATKATLSKIKVSRVYRENRWKIPDITSRCKG